MAECVEGQGTDENSGLWAPAHASSAGRKGRENGACDRLPVLSDPEGICHTIDVVEPGRNQRDLQESLVVEADSAQTSACVYLSFVVLVGLVLNAVLGWWWADPLAALGLVVFLVREGREALAAEHADDCCA